MSMTSSIEHVSLPVPALFDPEEEETIVPSLGYSSPPPGHEEDTAHGSLLDLEDDDQAILQAAMGDSRGTMFMITLAGFGLALGMIAALMI